MAVPVPSAPERVEFASTDPAEAREFLDHTYGWRTTVNRPDPGGRALTVSMSQAGIAGSAHAEAPGDMSYRVAGGDYVVIDSLFEGRFELDHDRGVDRYGPGDVFIANQPRAEFVSSTHDIRVLTTILPSALLAEVANSIADPGFGRVVSSVEFSSYSPIAGRGRRWQAVSRLVDELLADPDAGSAPLVVGPAARLLAATALGTFPHTAAGEAAAAGRDARPETLRRAMAFIEAHPDRDLSVATIAQAACVTPRAVQLAFRRYLGTTPTGYLRRVRLHHAHDQLLATDPARSTVSAVATRWGFANASQFAARYRQAFGEPPSRTLGR